MFGECLQFPINFLTNFQYDFGFDLPFLSNISLALMKNWSLAYFIILLTLFRWVLYLCRRKGELFCFTCLWSRSLICIALLIDQLNQGLSFGHIVMILMGIYIFTNSINLFVNLIDVFTRK
jgi:hypothetical protein